MMMVAMAGVGAVAWAQAPANPVMSPATAEAEQVAATAGTERRVQRRR